MTGRLVRGIVALLAVVSGLLLSVAAIAATRHVPGQFGTVAAAVAASASGDTILIGPGTYPEHINTGTRWLALVGTAGAAQTILDGAGNGRVLVLGNAGYLSGLTIRNGSDPYYAGGLLVTAPFPPVVPAHFLMEDCVLSGNSAYLLDAGIGGGMAVSDYPASATIRRCRFIDNFAGYQGGGASTDGLGFFEDCLFQGNYGGLFGGGLYGTSRVLRCLFLNNLTEIAGGGFYGAVSEFRNNTFVRNSAGPALVSVGGSVHIFGSTPGGIVANNIIALGRGPGIYCTGESPIRFECNDSWGNTGDNYAIPNLAQVDTVGKHNVSLDPQFCAAAQDNFTLMSTSPCAGGVPTCGLIGAFDVGCSVIPIEPVTWSRIKNLVH